MDTITQPAPGPHPPRLSGRQLLLVVGLGLLVLGLSAGAAWFVRSRLVRPGPPAPAAESGSAVGRGRLLYATTCASCHGPEGHGDGPSAAGLKPPPRDFAAGAWKHGRAPAAVRRVIAEGIPGTAMPASGQALSAADLDAVTAFVLTLGPREGGAEANAALRSPLERAGLTPTAGPRAAPELELLDAAGGRSSLAQRRGRVVLLVFWETTCLPCVKKLPGLERLADEFRAAGLVVLPVCLDEAEAGAVRDVAARHVKSLPLYREARALARLRYEVQSVPAAFLIGRDGRLLGVGTGPRDWSADEARELVRAALAN